jgi:hypothetical protein
MVISENSRGKDGATGFFATPKEENKMYQQSPKVRTESERQAREYQRKFINEAIAAFGNQEKLAVALCVTQQTVSKYKDGSNIMALSKMIRIAKLAGKGDIHVTWS